MQIFFQGKFRGIDNKQILQELQERAHDTFVSSFDMALTYIGLGRKGDALDWLQKVQNLMETTP